MWTPRCHSCASKGASFSSTHSLQRLKGWDRCLGSASMQIMGLVGRRWRFILWVEMLLLFLLGPFWGFFRISCFGGVVPHRLAEDLHLLLQGLYRKEGLLLTIICIMKEPTLAEQLVVSSSQLAMITMHQLMNMVY